MRVQNCLTCGNEEEIGGPWNVSVAYCSSCTEALTEAFEEGRELGMDHAEAWRYADDSLSTTKAVFVDGKRAGYSQTETGARLIKKNIKRRTQSNLALG